MTIESANRMLISLLTSLYDEREAASVASLIMERLTGKPKSIRVLHRADLFSPKQEELFQYYLSDLMRSRPVQYVLGEARFGPYSFFVDENVLIPRPETEELAEWLLEDSSSKGPGTTVLDIGTGSGCISIYIKKKRMDFLISGLDVSKKALEIALRNSLANEVDVEFFQCDIRDTGQIQKIGVCDMIISNPPYIPEKQKKFLDKHVKDFEPGLALFAPDDDPILFYKIIGNIAIQKLRYGGRVFLEIHHDFSKEIRDWYDKNGFLTELKKDFSGNNRMIKAWRN